MPFALSLALASSPLSTLPRARMVIATPQPPLPSSDGHGTSEHRRGRVCSGARSGAKHAISACARFAA
eukprot:2216257-Pleurochrysis_carterae.AAC.1